MAALAVKSGNAIVLKGGSEAHNSNEVLAHIVAQAGSSAGLPVEWLTLLTGREEVHQLLAFDQYVDLVIPRGSKEFVAKIKEESRIPVLGHSDGVCHVYVHEDADLAMATAIAVDSKTQYPAACNAAEVLLVHGDFAARCLVPLLQALVDAGVALEVCPRTAQMLEKAKMTNENKKTGIGEAAQIAPCSTKARTMLSFFLKSDSNWAVEYPRSAHGSQNC